MATCHKTGKCDVEQKTWCIGFECLNSEIVKNEKLRNHGQSCSESRQCESQYCKKPRCTNMKNIVDDEQCRNIGGICLLTTENLHEF